METQNIIIESKSNQNNEKPLWTILSDFTAEELAFIINYYDDLGSLYNDEALAELVADEEKIPGIVFGSFNDMMESCYKVGVGGKKSKIQKIAQQLKYKYIDPKEFFILTKAIHSQEPTVLIYLTRKILGEV